MVKFKYLSPEQKKISDFNDMYITEQTVDITYGKRKAGIMKETEEYLDRLEKELHMLRLRLSSLQEETFQRYNDGELYDGAEEILQEISVLTEGISKLREVSPKEKDKPILFQKDERMLFSMKFPRPEHLPEGAEEDIIGFIREKYTETVNSIRFGKNEPQGHGDCYLTHRELGNYISSLDDKKKEEAINGVRSLLLEQASSIERNSVSFKYDSGSYYTYVAGASFALPFTNRSLFEKACASFTEHEQW